VTDLDSDPGRSFDADVFSRMCASRGVLQHVTGRWSALIVVALLENNAPMRFAAIRRRVDGISDRMLSQTLGQIEREGIVVRTVHSTIPPHVEYGLTALGQKIAEPLTALIGIIESELPHVLAAQKAFDDADERRS
jgi:DNA-binding HxlR family transcriptional regulator